MDFIMSFPPEDKTKNNGFFKLKEINLKGVGFCRGDSGLLIYADGYCYPLKNIISLGIAFLILLFFVFSIAKPKIDFSDNEETVFNDIDVCKASVAALYGRPVEIMRFDGRKDGNIHIYYTRPVDGTKWFQRCSVGEKEVIWGNIDGRWRTGDLDDKVYYKKFLDRIDIIVEHSDGSATNKSYSASKFGKINPNVAEVKEEKSSTDANKKDEIIIDDVLLCLGGFLYFEDLDKSKIGGISIEERDSIVEITHMSSSGEDSFICGASEENITIGQWLDRNTILEEYSLRVINWTVFKDEYSLGFGEADKIIKKYKLSDIAFILEDKIIF